MTSVAACPHCGAPRVAGPECPRCGVIYARARPRRAAALRPDALEPPVAASPGASASSPPAPVVGDGVEDARGELMLRAIGPPVALLLSWLLVSSSTGHMLVRTFLSMWVHELGHAVAAWLCGHLAFPGPWRTPISQDRSAAVVLTVAAALAHVGWRGWRGRSWALVALGGAALGGELVCVLLPASSARAFVTFAGDGGALVLGTLLVATVYTPRGGWFRQGALRWGLLAIGAASFVDVFSTWLRARSDPDAVPLGEIEGIGLSDASKLLEVHGWSLHRITGTYVALGAACGAALAALYVYGLHDAHARARRSGHVPWRSAERRAR